MRSPTALPVALAFLLAVAGLMGDPARADDDDALPHVTVLPCEKGCADTKPAELINRITPRFPPTYAYGAGVYVEGLVRFHYTIGTDGAVRDIVMESLIGPQEFADTARAALASRRFKPAERDGKPIEQISIVMFAFGMYADPGARMEMKRHYDQAVTLAKDGKIDDALAILTTEQARPELNFYERGMLWHLTALLEIQRKDYLAAQRAIDLAMLVQSRFSRVDRVYMESLKLGIRISVQLGDIGGASAIYGTLKRQTYFDPKDDIVAFMDAVQKRADTMDEIAAAAQLPPNSQDGVTWEHAMLRRVFRFDSIGGGTLDRFQLRCQQGAIESPITETAQWHVPASWGDCWLYVFGKPGTTFLLHEAKA